MKIILLIIALFLSQTLLSQKIGAGYQSSWSKDIEQQFFFLSYNDGPIWFDVGGLNFSDKEKKYYSFFLSSEVNLIEVFLRKKTLFTSKVGSSLVMKKKDPMLFFFTSFGVNFKFVELDFLLLTSNYRSIGENAYRFDNRPSFGIKAVVFVPIKERSFSKPYL